MKKLKPKHWKRYGGHHNTATTLFYLHKTVLITNVIVSFIQVSSTFDMIGYPTWVEDLDALDKYYENVSHFHETEKLGIFGFTCKSAPPLESLSRSLPSWNSYCLQGISNVMFPLKLTIGPANGFENYLEARRFFHNKSMNRRGKTINRKEWVNFKYAILAVKRISCCPLPCSVIQNNPKTSWRRRNDII